MFGQNKKYAEAVKWMPPEYVRTIREAIFYEFAILLTRSTPDGCGDGISVEEQFRALREGKITMSGLIQEWEKTQEVSKECVFCGEKENLERDHLIPLSRGGTQDPENIAWSCSTCNASRGRKGVFQWLGLKKKDTLPLLVVARYLKQLYDLHGEKFTLDVNRDLISQLCSKCRNDETCQQWNTLKKLTCFCLESIF